MRRNLESRRAGEDATLIMSPFGTMQRGRGGERGVRVLIPVLSVNSNDAGCRVSGLSERAACWRFREQARQAGLSENEQQPYDNPTISCGGFVGISNSNSICSFEVNAQGHKLLMFPADLQRYRISG